MKETRVKFLKNRFYRGKEYKTGDIINMLSSDLQAYVDCKVIKVLGPDKSKNIKNDYSKLSYKKLQKICKNKNISAVGTRDKLITSLNDLNKV